MPLTKTELTARDVMTPEPVCIEPAATIRELARTFEEYEISGAPVTDEAGKVIGIVTKTDLMRRCTEGSGDVPPAYLFEVLSDQRPSDDAMDLIPEPLICVEDFMTRDPIMVTPELPAAAVAKLMFENNIHRVIVSDVEKLPLGIITSLDLLGVFPEHISGGQTSGTAG